MGRSSRRLSDPCASCKTSDRGYRSPAGCVTRRNRARRPVLRETSYAPEVPSTYLLTWNTNRWTWDSLARDARRSTEGDVVKERWSSGNTKRIAVGDRHFLMRLGMEPRGVVASGWAISMPQPGPHWDDERAAKGDTTLYVDAEFERVLDPDVAAPLAIRELEKQFPDFPWSP